MIYLHISILGDLSCCSSTLKLIIHSEIVFLVGSVTITFATNVSNENVDGWTKPRCNLIVVEKVVGASRNALMHGRAKIHEPAPLPEQERRRALVIQGMAGSTKSECRAS
ncbi:hypothetical protein Mapa_015592 [Marchantia paleacea]|nr:hypothetical protein Mapa_015592 [Marchantia paleacea]